MLGDFSTSVFVFTSGLCFDSNDKQWRGNKSENLALGTRKSVGLLRAAPAAQSLPHNKALKQILHLVKIKQRFLVEQVLLSTYLR